MQNRIIIFLTITLTFLSFSVSSQNIQLERCGFKNFTAENEAKIDYLIANPISPRGTIYNIPCQIHIVGTNEGEGYYKKEDLLDMFCNLNPKFVDAEMFFYMEGEINYIDKSTYYDHNYTQGFQMMQNHNVDDRVNIYFVNDPAGACGYYSQQGNALAIAISCAGPNSTTLAHEIGHFFFLPHTFSGWEGQTPPAASNRDRVDKVNCQNTGDKLCDTPPDYAPDRWSCPYSGTFTDPVGATFKPDETLFMSYSSDNCQTRFSQNQISRMRAVIAQYRTNLLPAQNPAASVSLASTVNLEPADNGFSPSDYTVLKWKSVPNAESYHIMVSRFLSFSNNVLDEISTDTIAIVSGLDVGKTYRWKVKPMMRTNICEPYGSITDFEATSATGVAEIENLAQVSFFPNPVRAGSPIRVNINSQFSSGGALELYTTNGKLISHKSIEISQGLNEININSSHLQAGIYIVHLTSTAFNLSKRIMVID